MNYLDLFLSQYISECTKKTYHYVLTRLFNSINKPVDKITKLDLLKYKATLKEYAFSTQAQTIAIIKSYFKFLVQNEILSINPAETLKAPPSVNKPKDYISREEALELMNFANTREKAILAVYLSTGIRVSELINLKLKDYLYNNEQIYIEVKGGKYRTLIFNKDCQNYINEYLKERKEGCDNLFVSNQGTPMAANSLNKTWKKLAKKANINKNITNHTFRSTFITMIACEYDITMAQIAVGHNNIQTTRKYIRGLEEEAKQIMKNITL